VGADLSETTSQRGLIDIYGTLHPPKKEHTFFSSTLGKFHQDRLYADSLTKSQQTEEEQNHAEHVISTIK
jgi:hypothetical protein